MPFRNLLTILAAAFISILCYQKAEWNKYAGTMSRALKLVEVHALEPVPSRQLFDGAMDGMMKQLDDPYSGYLTQDKKREIDESLEQKFAGIGVVVGKDTKTKRLAVMMPLNGTPAFKAGLRAGDAITAIDGTPTDGLTVRDAQKLIRGKEGTTVQLLVQKVGESQPRPLALMRAMIPMESVLGDVRREDGTWDFRLAENPRLGFVRIVTFGERTVDELKAALDTLRGQTDGVIIDLRDNAGGLLTTAVGACDLFLESGTIVSTRGRNGVFGRDDREFNARPEVALDPAVPIVILSNRFSASASEIVAACLQDHQRAIVVGQRSWGKGTVQNIIELEGGRSALKLTTASYWRPSGKNIHRTKKASDSDEWGVRPDDGYEVLVPDEALKQVYRYRRWRDIFHPAGIAGPPTPNGIVAPKTDEPTDQEKPSDDTKTDASAASDDDSEDLAKPPEAVDDPQLRKAIEYLNQRTTAKTKSGQS